MQVVVVGWRDPTTFNHWQVEEDAVEQTAGLIVSAGFLLKKGRKYLMVLLNKGVSNGAVSDYVTIPRGCVEFITVLGKVNVETGEVE